MHDEAHIVLKSVFDNNDLNNFIRLNKLDKLAELSDLSDLMVGIRLFNRDCGKGGLDIEDCNYANINRHTLLTRCSLI